MSRTGALLRRTVSVARSVKARTMTLTFGSAGRASIAMKEGFVWELKVVRVVVIVFDYIQLSITQLTESITIAQTKKRAPK